MISVSFTGHRPDKLGGYEQNSNLSIFVKNWLEEVIDRIIIKFHDVEFISGGAQGVDLWAAEIVLRKKEEYKNNKIKLTMTIPFKEFGAKLPPEPKNYYYFILSQADRIKYVHQGIYPGPYVLQLRNEWMVNHSQIVVAVWDGSSGGTMNCYLYAKSKDRKIIRLNTTTGETIKYNKKVAN